MPKTSKSQTPAPVALHPVVMPRSVKLMLEKYNKNYAHHPPHKRKRLEVACVIQATGIERLAQELEELARTLREGGGGYMGSGGGYYMTLAYAVTKRHNDPSSATCEMKTKRSIKPATLKRRRTAGSLKRVVRAHRCCCGIWSKRRCKNKAQWKSSVEISRKHGGKKVLTYWCYAHRVIDDVPLRPNAKLSA